MLNPKTTTMIDFDYRIPKNVENIGLLGFQVDYKIMRSIAETLFHYLYAYVWNTKGIIDFIIF